MGMRFATRAARTGSIFVLAAAISYAATTVANFRVLLPSAPSGPLPAVSAGHVTATVGSTTYKVNSIGHDDRLANAPIVIVADFQNTAPKFHPCIVSEIIPVLRKYEAR